jgi:thiamine-monophosphate kinase
MEGHVTPPDIRGKLVESVYWPKARLREGLALAKTGVVTSSIDSSDGLAICLHELKKNSVIGLDVTNVPIAPEVRKFAEIHGLDPEALALYGGEEYELVLTVKPEGWRNAVKAVEEVGGNLIAIGNVVDGTEVTQRKGNVVEPIPLRGWEHFKKHAV